MSKRVEQFQKLFEGAEEIERLPYIEKIISYYKKSSQFCSDAVSQDTIPLVNWITKTCYDLNSDEDCRIILEIVSLFEGSKFLIIEDDDDKENKKGMKVTEGCTLALTRQIKYNIKNFDKDDSYYKLKGLIIHELFHYALYYTFRNESKPFYNDDNESKIEWENIRHEIEVIAKNDEEFKAIRETFAIQTNNEPIYKSDKIINELIVRILDGVMRHGHEKDKLDKFINKYQKLYNIFKTKVMKQLKDESKYIQIAFELNKDLALRLKNNYSNITIQTKLTSIIEDKRNKVIKTNHIFLTISALFTSLMGELIPNECTQNPFFELEYLWIRVSELETKLDKLQIFLKNRHKKTIIVTWDSNSVSFKLKEYIENISNLQIIVIMKKTNQKTQQKSHNDFAFEEINYDFKTSYFHEFYFQNLSVDVVDNENKITKVSLSEFINFNEFKELPVPNFQSMTDELDPFKGLNLIRKFSSTNDNYIEREYVLTSKNNIIIQHKNILFEKNDILYTSEAGSGKSTEMSENFFRLRKKFSNHIILFVNFSNYIKELEILQSKGFKDLENFFEKFLHYNKTESKILKMMLDKNKIIFLFDSLDEISPYYYQLIEDIFNAIKQKNARIIAATRPHLKDKLCEKYNFENLQLRSLNEQNSIKFVKEILEKHEPILTKNDIKTHKNIIKNFLKVNNFHTPLLLKMIIEYSLSYKLDKTTQLSKIYKNFIRKLDRKFQNEELDEVEKRKFYIKYAIKNLRLDLYREKDMIDLSAEDYEEFISRWTEADPSILDKIQRNGILKIEGDDIRFIHASFREYFLAEFLKEYTTLKLDHFRPFINEILAVVYYEGRFEELLKFLRDDKDFLGKIDSLPVLKQNIEGYLTISDCIDIFPILKFLKFAINGSKDLQDIFYERKSKTSCSILFEDPLTLSSFLSKLNIDDILLRDLRKIDENSVYYVNDRYLINSFSNTEDDDKIHFYISCTEYEKMFEELIFNKFRNFNYFQKLGVENIFSFLSKCSDYVISYPFLKLFSKLVDFAKMDSKEPLYCDFAIGLIFKSNFDDIQCFVDYVNDLLKSVRARNISLKVKNGFFSEPSLHKIIEIMNESEFIRGNIFKSVLDIFYDNFQLKNAKASIKKLCFKKNEFNENFLLACVESSHPFKYLTCLEWLEVNQIFNNEDIKEFLLLTNENRHDFALIQNILLNSKIEVPESFLEKYFESSDDKERLTELLFCKNFITLLNCKLSTKLKLSELKNLKSNLKLILSILKKQKKIFLQKFKFYDLNCLQIVANFLEDMKYIQIFFLNKEEKFFTSVRVQSIIKVKQLSKLILKIYGEDWQKLCKIIHFLLMNENISNKNLKCLLDKIGAIESNQKFLKIMFYSENDIISNCKSFCFLHAIVLCRGNGRLQYFHDLFRDRITNQYLKIHLNCYYNGKTVFQNLLSNHSQYRYFELMYKMNKRIYSIQQIKKNFSKNDEELLLRLMRKFNGSEKEIKSLKLLINKFISKDICYKIIDTFLNEITKTSNYSEIENEDQNNEIILDNASGSFLKDIIDSQITFLYEKVTSKLNSKLTMEFTFENYNFAKAFFKKHLSRKYFQRLIYNSLNFYKDDFVISEFKSKQQKAKEKKILLKCKELSRFFSFEEMFCDFLLSKDKCDLISQNIHLFSYLNEQLKGDWENKNNAKFVNTVLVFLHFRMKDNILRTMRNYNPICHNLSKIIKIIQNFVVKDRQKIKEFILKHEILDIFLCLQAKDRNNANKLIKFYKLLDDDEEIIEFLSKKIIENEEIKILTFSEFFKVENQNNEITDFFKKIIIKSKAIDKVCPRQRNISNSQPPLFVNLYSSKLGSRILRELLGGENNFSHFSTALGMYLAKASNNECKIKVLKCYKIHLKEDFHQFLEKCVSHKYDKKSPLLLMMLQNNSLTTCKLIQYIFDEYKLSKEFLKVGYYENKVLKTPLYLSAPGDGFFHFLNFYNTELKSEKPSENDLNILYDWKMLQVCLLKNSDKNNIIKKYVLKHYEAHFKEEFGKLFQMKVINDFDKNDNNFLHLIFKSENFSEDFKIILEELFHKYISKKDSLEILKKLNSKERNPLMEVKAVNNQNYNLAFEFCNTILENDEKMLLEIVF